jgi:hypothetical protein
MSAPSASAHTHVGTAVHWHGFESLSAVRGEFEDSPEFMLLGNEWSLAIYPGGDDDAAEEMVSLDLYNESNKAIDIDFRFNVNDDNGKQVEHERTVGRFNFTPEGTDS